MSFLQRRSYCTLQSMQPGVTFAIFAFNWSHWTGTKPRSQTMPDLWTVDSAGGSTSPGFHGHFRPHCNPTRQENSSYSDWPEKLRFRFKPGMTFVTRGNLTDLPMRKKTKKPVKDELYLRPESGSILLESEFVHSLKSIWTVCFDSWIRHHMSIKTSRRHTNRNVKIQ